MIRRFAALVIVLALVGAIRVTAQTQPQSQRLPVVEQPRTMLLWDNGAPGALG